MSIGLILETTHSVSRHWNVQYIWEPPDLNPSYELLIGNLTDASSMALFNESDECVSIRSQLLTDECSLDTFYQHFQTKIYNKDNTCKYQDRDLLWTLPHISFKCPQESSTLRECQRKMIRIFFLTLLSLHDTDLGVRIKGYLTLNAIIFNAKYVDDFYQVLNLFSVHLQKMLIRLVTFTDINYLLTSMNQIVYIQKEFQMHKHLISTLISLFDLWNIKGIKVSLNRFILSIAEQRGFSFYKLQKDIGLEERLKLVLLRLLCEREGHQESVFKVLSSLSHDDLARSWNDFEPKTLINILEYIFKSGTQASFVSQIKSIRLQFLSKAFFDRRRMTRLLKVFLRHARITLNRNDVNIIIHYMMENLLNHPVLFLASTVDLKRDIEKYIKDGAHLIGVFGLVNLLQELFRQLPFIDFDTNMFEFY